MFSAICYPLVRQGFAVILY